MTTTTTPTAPKFWSADPLTAIDQLTRTHTADAIAALRSTIDDLDQLLARHQRDTATAIDQLLCARTETDARLDTYAAVTTLITLRTLRIRHPKWPNWPLPDGPPKRLLRDLEMGAIRFVSLDNDYRACTVAALEAGASSGELFDISADDVHPDGEDQLKLQLHGSRTAATRTVPIPAWAADAFRAAIEERPDGSLLYRGRATCPADAQSALLMSTRAAIKGAKIAPRVPPESIRNTAALNYYLSLPPEVRLQRTAERLGIDEDKTLARIGMNTTPPDPDEPAIVW